MLNFDVDRFVAIQTGAVDLAEPIDAAVGALLERGAENLFFLGTGGAGVLMQPAAQLLQRTAALPVFLDHAAEIVRTDSVHLGPRSIVVIPSLSGTTPESIEVLEFARGKGATVITLTADGDSPLARAADHTFTNFAEDDTSSESFYLQSLLIALAILRREGRRDDHDAVVAELQRLPRLLLDVKAAFEDRAEELAEAFQDEPYHVITGAGSAWPEAWYYGTCILEEMQWIRTRPVHASDFFHGTLELVEEGVSVVLLKGEDATRPLVERVEKFVPSVTSRMLVLDSADVELPGVPTDVRALLSPVVLATVLERVSAHLEVL